MMQVKIDSFWFPKDTITDPFVWLFLFARNGERQKLP
jgi:hypothetical protein